MYRITYADLKMGKRRRLTVAIDVERWGSVERRYRPFLMWRDKPGKGVHSLGDVRRYLEEARDIYMEAYNNFAEAWNEVARHYMRLAQLRFVMPVPPIRIDVEGVQGYDVVLHLDMVFGRGALARHTPEVLEVREGFVTVEDRGDKLYVDGSPSPNYTYLRRRSVI